MIISKIIILQLSPLKKIQEEQKQRLYLSTKQKEHRTRDHNSYLNSNLLKMVGNIPNIDFFLRLFCMSLTIERYIIKIMLFLKVLLSKLDLVQAIIPKIFQQWISFFVQVILVLYRTFLHYLLLKRYYLFLSPFYSQIFYCSLLSKP